MSDPVEDAIAAEMSDEELEPTDPVEEDEAGEEDEAAPAEDAPPSEDLESFALMEERGKKFELLTKHVAKRTGELLGDDAAMVGECPMCTYWGMPGWIPSVDMPIDLQTSILHLMGRHAPEDYKADAYSRICDECNGLGQTVSGSRVPGNEYLPCIACKASGWVAVGAERSGNLLFTPNGTATATPLPDLPSAVPPDPDQYDNMTVAEARAAGVMVIAPFVA